MLPPQINFPSINQRKTRDEGTAKRLSQEELPNPESIPGNQQDFQPGCLPRRAPAVCLASVPGRPFPVLVLKPGGRLVTIAASGEQTADKRTPAAFFIVEPSRSQLKEIAGLIDSGAIPPIVGSVFPLAAARKACQHEPDHGKTVLEVIAEG
jgi:hypothetical protein